MAKTKRFHVLEGKEDNTAFKMSNCVPCVSSLLDKHLDSFLCLVVSKLVL